MKLHKGDHPQWAYLNKFHPIWIIHKAQVITFTDLKPPLGAKQEYKLITSECLIHLIEFTFYSQQRCFVNPMMLIWLHCTTTSTSSHLQFGHSVLYQQRQTSFFDLFIFTITTHTFRILFFRSNSPVQLRVLCTTINSCLAVLIFWSAMLSNDWMQDV